MKLKDLLRKSTFVIVISCLLMLLAAVTNLIVPFVLSTFVDNVVALDFNKALLYLLLVISLWIIGYVIAYLNQRCVNKIREKSLIIYRDSIYKKVKNSDSTIDKDFYLSALVNDSVQLDSAIDALFTTISTGLQTLFSFIGLLYLHWIFAVFNVGLIFASILLSSGLEGTVVENQKNRSSKNEEFLAGIRDTLSGFSVWNVYNRKKQMFDNLFHTSTTFEASKESINNVEAKVMTYQYLLSGVGQCISSVVGFLLIVFGNLTVGSIFSQGELAGSFANNLQEAFNGYMQCKGINAVLEEKCAQLPEEDTTIQNINDYDIHIKDLSFSYPDKPIFNGLNLTFEYGKKYLIIGPSGFGKTTLLNLLSKNISDYSGTITLGENEYSTMNNYTVHHYIGYVEQSPYIFKDTMRNNITLYHEYSDSEVKKAMDTALVSEFFDADKVDEVINPDELSGGQNQRIALSRELINDHKIILFDESINAIDKEMTEEIIQQLLQLPQTVILVSHSYDESMKNAFDQVIDITKQ